MIADRGLSLQRLNALRGWEVGGLRIVKTVRTSQSLIDIVFSTLSSITESYKRIAVETEVGSKGQERVLRTCKVSSPLFFLFGFFFSFFKKVDEGKGSAL